MSKGWSGSPRHTESHGAGPRAGAPVVRTGEPGPASKGIAPKNIGMTMPKAKAPGKMPVQRGGE